MNILVFICGVVTVMTGWCFLCIAKQSYKTDKLDFFVTLFIAVAHFICGIVLVSCAFCL